MSFIKQHWSLDQLSKLALSDPEQALAGLQEWVKTARHLGDNGQLSIGQYELARCLRALNRLGEAVEASSEACAMAEATADLRSLNHALTFHAMLMDDMGRSEEALNLVERAMSLDYALEPEDLASAKGICGALLCRMGRLDEGLQALREAIVVPELPYTSRLMRHMALVWQLADDAQRPQEAAHEWEMVQVSISREPIAGRLATALAATELCILSTLRCSDRLQAASEALLASHINNPHYATGWALMLALESLAATGHTEAAQWLIETLERQPVELRKPDLDRWARACRTLALMRSDDTAQAQRARAAELDADDSAATNQDARLLVMQLRNLDYRHSLANSRKDTRRLRQEMLRREREVRNARSFPSLLDELSQLHDYQDVDVDGLHPGQLGFHLVYQPFVDMSTGAIKGAEVLLRLNHPARGQLSPAEFIPRLDVSGEIEEVGRWVISEACRQLHRWQANFPSHVLAVNVSAAQLEVSGLADHVASQLRAHGLPPGVFELEVTETMASVESRTMITELERLRALGIGVSIDDFGTGYSNFARLLDLQPGKIKIDRSLVNRITTGQRQNQTVGALIHAAHSMGLSVTAEGIEHTEQAHVLSELNCDYAQGYLLSKPVDCMEMTRLLKLPIGHWQELLSPAG